MKRLYLPLLLLLALAACAPQQTAPHQLVVREQTPVAFYPHNIGIFWIYLPQTDPSDYPKFRLSVLGPGQFGNASATKFRFSGRGQERIYYRRYGINGVELLGFEEKITLTKVTFKPPILEYPPEKLLQPGYVWGGRSVADSEFVLPSGNQKQADISIDYRYRVKGESEVQVPAGVFKALVIELKVTDNKGNKTTQEIWFVPHVGEVRTKEGLVLIEKGF